MMGASLMLVVSGWSCSGGDEADERSSGGKGGSGGAGATGGAGGMGGTAATGATGGTGATGAMGATGGTGATGGSGAVGGNGATGGDASADAPNDQAAEGEAGEAGPDAGNCIPSSDAGAPDAGCPVGQYFNPCKQTCTPCTDLSFIQLGGKTSKDVTLSNPSGAPGRDQLYPRITKLSGVDRIVYRHRIPANNPKETQIVTATLSSGSWTGFTENLGNLVNYPNEDESAPLLVPQGVLDPSNGSTAAEPFLLFDSKRNGKPQVYSSQLFKSNGSPAPLGSPVNQATSGSRDYNPAYSYSGAPPRLYWVSDRNSTPGLYTVPVSGGSVTHVPLTLASGCAVTDEDMEPWVTPDGTLLLFSSPRREPPNCALPLNSGKRGLYYTYLDPTTGQQIGAATELSGVRADLEKAYNKTDFELRTPSLDPGYCTLYFSSDIDGGTDIDIFLSTR
jgi:hypothetical protein